MKSIRLDLKDLFDDRIIYLAEPGLKEPVKIQVARKNHFSDPTYVLFHKGGSGNLLMLTKLGLTPSVTSVRMFAKRKQAQRWCTNQPKLTPANSPFGCDSLQDEQARIVSPSEILAEDVGFFDPV